MHVRVARTYHSDEGLPVGHVLVLGQAYYRALQVVPLQALNAVVVGQPDAVKYQFEILHGVDETQLVELV